MFFGHHATYVEQLDKEGRHLTFSPKKSDLGYCVAISFPSCLGTRLDERLMGRNDVMAKVAGQAGKDATVVRLFRNTARSSQIHLRSDCNGTSL